MPGHVATSVEVIGAEAIAAEGLGSDEMAALLIEVRGRTDQENGFFGKGKVEALRALLQETNKDEEPVRHLRTLTQLGSAEVDYGNLNQGIEKLTEAYALLPANKIPEPVRAQVIAELGYAYLRLAETENCCARHSPESCIVPLQGAAIHQSRRGSETAIRYFKEALQLNGVDLYLRMKCVWLLNLAYMTLGGYPDQVPHGLGIPPVTFTSRIHFPQFPNVSKPLGIDQFNLAGGAVLDDFDGDHDLDLITSSWDTAVSMRYFENVRGRFRDRTKDSGLSLSLGGLNLIQADYDNDGDLDLYVLRGAWMRQFGKHPNSLLQNQGDGTFIDRTFAAGLGKVHFPTQTAAWGDYDLDGDLDLYVGNESLADHPAPSQLFKNEGDGTFTDVAIDAGVTNDRFCKGVVWGDVDGDRWPDIIVSNLGAKNRLFRNQGDGTFEDVAESAGITSPIKSFPLWTWDFNNDGNLDVFIAPYGCQTGDFVAHYIGKQGRNETPGHFVGNGKGQFLNMATDHSLSVPMLPMGSNYGDLNNDGFLDFYLGTGDPTVSVVLPNMMFLNHRGQGFIDVTMAGGFGHLQKGHAIVFADFDEDGDQDIFEQMGGAKRVDKFHDALYQNPGFDSNWLKIRLVGSRSNRCAIGARIHAVIEENGVERSIYRHIGSGGSFGANPLRQHIGIGHAEKVSRLEIYWPATECSQSFTNVPAGRFIEVVEDAKDYSLLSPGDD